jgi:hypothetical protein
VFILSFPVHLTSETRTIQRPDLIQLCIIKCKDVQDCSYALSCVTPRHFPGENEQRYATPQDSWCSVRDAITESAECKSQALKRKLSCLMYVRVFFLGKRGGGCLKDKWPPDVSLALRHTQNVEQSVKEVRRFSVIITCRKVHKNSALLQQMLKIFPSLPNAVGVQAELLEGKLLISHCGCCFWDLAEFADLLYTLYLLRFSTNKSNKMLNQGNVGGQNRE